MIKFSLLTTLFSAFFLLVQNKTENNFVSTNNINIKNSNYSSKNGQFIYSKTEKHVFQGDNYLIDVYEFSEPISVPVFSSPRLYHQAESTTLSIKFTTSTEVSLKEMIGINNSIAFIAFLQSASSKLGFTSSVEYSTFFSVGEEYSLSLGPEHPYGFYQIDVIQKYTQYKLEVKVGERYLDHYETVTKYGIKKVTQGCETKEIPYSWKETVPVYSYRYRHCSEYSGLCVVPLRRTFVVS